MGMVSITRVLLPEVSHMAQGFGWRKSKQFEGGLDLVHPWPVYSCMQMQQQ